MKVLITGAGLIGTHTAKELVDCGDDVTLFDVAPKADYIRHVTGRDLKVVHGDIRDLAALVDAFQRVHPECVIHLAASVGEANIQNVYAGFQVNLVATIDVAEAARLTGVRRIVHASTQALTAPKIRMNCSMRIGRSIAGDVSITLPNSVASMC